MRNLRCLLGALLVLSLSQQAQAQSEVLLLCQPLTSGGACSAFYQGNPYFEINLPAGLLIDGQVEREEPVTSFRYSCVNAGDYVIKIWLFHLNAQNEPIFPPYAVSTEDETCSEQSSPGGGTGELDCNAGENGQETDNPENNCPQSPILLDLDRNNFHLSAGPASFDIDADGEDESITWTKAGQLDAFLYLDRNGNGVVDDGGELFGNHTRLADGSRAAHGYIALAEFDLPANGGVEDGVIDPLDAVFDDLRVWIDYDADGSFDSSETFSLAEVNVVAIGLETMELPRTDPHGNAFKYNGRAWIEEDGRTFKIWTTDVFFRERLE